jgi:DNA-binding CsgD family transcriptional regulator
MQAPLTPREIECMRWVCRASRRGVGKEMDIAATTVHFHVECVKKKLRAKTRTQAASTLVLLGYI